MEGCNKSPDCTKSSFSGTQARAERKETFERVHLMNAQDKMRGEHSKIN